MKCLFTFSFLLAAVVLLGNLSSAEFVNLVQDGQFQDINGATNQPYGYLPTGSFLNQWTVSGTDSFGSVGSATGNHELIGYSGLSSGYSSMIDAYGNVLFLQYNNKYTPAGTMQATQTVTGLEVGKTYYISGNVASRQSGIDLGVSLTGSNASSMVNWSTTGTYSINRNGFLPFSQSFVATDTTAELALINNSKTNDKSSSGFQNIVISETAPTGWTSYKRWSNDNPFDANGTYTHAIHFQSATGSAFSVKNIVFATISGNKEITGDFFSRSAPSDIHDLSVSLDAGSESQSMGNGFMAFKAGGNISLSGLLPGYTYETTIFTNMWGNKNSRNALISVNDQTPLLLEATNYEGRLGTDINQGTALTWSGVASEDGTLNFVFAQQYNPLHIHGITNRVVSGPEGVQLREMFQGINGGHTGSTMVGAKVDAFDSISKTGASWQIRGSNNQPTDLQYSKYQNEYAALLGPNTGAALELGGDSWNALADQELKFSVDIALATLDSETDYQYARGAGFGFFSDDYGTGEENVGRGFSGLVVAPDGALYFYSNMSNGDSPTVRTELITYTGDWSKDDFNTLSFTALLSEDGETATLTGVSLGGSDSDYSDLIGNVFQTTDLLGLISSGSGGNSYFSNLTIENSVPEPSTWALLVLGAAGIWFWRKRARQEGGAGDCTPST